MHWINVIRWFKMIHTWQKVLWLSTKSVLSFILSTATINLMDSLFLRQNVGWWEVTSCVCQENLKICFTQECPFKRVWTLSGRRIICLKQCPREGSWPEPFLRPPVICLPLIKNLTKTFRHPVFVRTLLISVQFSSLMNMNPSPRILFSH